MSAISPRDSLKQFVESFEAKQTAASDITKRVQDLRSKLTGAGFIEKRKINGQIKDLTREHSSLENELNMDRDYYKIAKANIERTK